MAFFVLHLSQVLVVTQLLTLFWQDLYLPTVGEDSAKFSDKGRNHIGQFDKLFDGKLLGPQVENGIRTDGTIIAYKWLE